MATESNTTYLNLPYPTAANNGTNFAQGIADFANAIDPIIPAFLSDALLPGVTSTTAAVIASPAVNATTGAVSYASLSAGSVYILAASGELVRNVIPVGSFSATPASLPASGKYASYGIDLVANVWGGTASVALTAKGTDQTTGALAFANPVSLTTGHYRLANINIQNGGGGSPYSLNSTVNQRVLAAPYASAVNIAHPAGNFTHQSALNVPNGVGINVNLTTAGVVYVSGRAWLDKTVDTAAATYAAIVVDPFAGVGTQVLDVFTLSSSNVFAQATQGAGTAPTNTMVFYTGGTGVVTAATSGTNYASLASPSVVGQAMGIYLSAGVHTIAWAFNIDSPGTYVFGEAALAVHL